MGKVIRHIYTAHGPSDMRNMNIVIFFSPRGQSRVFTHYHTHGKTRGERKRERVASLPLLADPTHARPHPSWIYPDKQKVKENYCIQRLG
jgi:transcription initiation factor IIF auxiliary subunit